MLAYRTKNRQIEQAGKTEIDRLLEIWTDTWGAVTHDADSDMMQILKYAHNVIMTRAPSAWIPAIC